MEQQEQTPLIKYWDLSKQHGFITVEHCISVRMRYTRLPNTRNVTLQGAVGGKRYHKEKIVHNPLAMLAAIDEFRKIRDNKRRDHVKTVLEQEQANAKAKAKAKALEKQRELAALKQLQKQQEEERWRASAAYKVRQPIQRILQRVKPVNNEYTYSNVFGKSVDQVMP